MALKIIAALQRGDRENVELTEAVRQDALAADFPCLGKNRADLIRDGKSEPWKMALASALKWRTTATNRWLGENLKLGALHEVSRKIGRWKQQPDPALDRKRSLTTRHKVCAPYFHRGAPLPITIRKKLKYV